MTIQEKKEYCKKFFEELAEKLKDTHVIVRSCNQDESAYLVPIGTEKQITYYGKPDNSFRISDHWNWYSNLKKCSDPNYIQCLNVDLACRCKNRKGPALASEPYWAWCVAMYKKEVGYYHTMVGEFYNPVLKKQEFLTFDGLDTWIPIFQNEIMHASK